MTPKTLRFRARGDAMHPNHEREDAGTKAFVGRKYVEVEPGQWGFVPTGEDEQVPYRAEYVKACKDGDLYPADQATADACGVAFDRNFGSLPGLPSALKYSDRPVAMPTEKG